MKMDTMNTVLLHWGIIGYEEAWKKQTEWFDEAVSLKNNDKAVCNRIIFCEHLPVYTLGKSGKDANMLLSEAQLEKIGATLFHIDRGGDITFHGPGQLVAYPIIDLDCFGLGLRDYIYLLEEAVIHLCAEYGIKGERMDKATGVWLEVGTPRARKICAIGVRSSRFITMHGLALNVNTDLKFFSYINPCGFIDKGVTSLEKELGRKVELQEVEDKLGSILQKMLEEKRIVYSATTKKSY